MRIAHIFIIIYILHDIMMTITMYANGTCYTKKTNTIGLHTYSCEPHMG